MPIIPEYLYQLEHRHAPDSPNTTTITTPSSLTTSSRPDTSSPTLERDEVVGRWTFTPTHKTPVREPVASTNFPSPRQALRVNSEGSRNKYRSEPSDSKKRVAGDLSDLKILRRKIRNTHVSLQISDALLRSENKITDVEPPKMESKYKTRNQQIVRASSKNWLAESYQSLNVSSLVSKRVLPPSQRHQSSEALPPSEERKQTKKLEESKPSASVSPSAAGKKEIFKDISSENWKVGLLLSSKALVQLMVNPMVGSLTAHIGYTLPLIFGTHNLLLSAIRRYLSDAVLFCNDEDKCVWSDKSLLCFHTVPCLT